MTLPAPSQVAIDSVWATAEPPAAAISATTASASAASTSLTTTDAPWRTASSA